MRILKLTNNTQAEIIKTALKILNEGGLVIFPTETTYGAGVDATNPRAVQKLLSYKSKREGKPLSIGVTSKQMAQKYVELNLQAENLIDKFLPGPITVVCLGKNKVAPQVESEFGTLGLRIPDYPLILEIIKKFAKPITTTSANASGKKRPYQISDILNNLSQKQKNLIDLVIDAGELPKNEPSTVIDTTLSTPLTLRDRKTRNDKFEAPNKLVNIKSQSEQETKTLAGKLLLKNWEKLKQTGLVIALDGPLGAGKTIFAGGAAKFLNIDEKITSPTYNYLAEYDFQRHKIRGKFYHLDLWKIDSEAQFDLLEINQLKQPNTLIIIEWWQQVAKFASKSLQPDLLITLAQKNNSREIAIHEN